MLLSHSRFLSCGFSYLVLHPIFLIGFVWNFSLFLWVFFFFTFLPLEFSIYFGYQSSISCRTVKTLYHSIGCFVLMTMSFAYRSLQFHEVPLIVDLSAWSIGVLFRKLSPGLMSSRLCHTFCPIRPCVSDFMLRSLIHFKIWN